MFLQSAAWVGMFLSYAQADTLGAALVKTFDGKHPCTLCKIVQKSAQSKDQRAVPKLGIKLDDLLTGQLTWLYPPWIQPDPQIPFLQALTNPHSPPSPPPRLA